MYYWPNITSAAQVRTAAGCSNPQDLPKRERFDAAEVVGKSGGDCERWTDQRDKALRQLEIAQQQQTATRDEYTGARKNRAALKKQPRCITRSQNEPSPVENQNQKPVLRRSRKSGFVGGQNRRRSANCGRSKRGLTNFSCVMDTRASASTTN